ncbi:MAG: thioredoxin domain-containing protein [Candidatus Obscuribacterales bacterium]
MMQTTRARALLCLLFVSFFFVSLFVGQGAVFASTADLGSGRDFLLEKKYAEAARSLELYLKDDRKSAEAQCLIGEAYLGMKNYKQARKHLRQALRLGRGSETAKRANQALMSLPADLTRPKMGPATRLLAALFGFSRDRGAGMGARPTIINFYASWCEPCRQLDRELSGVEERYGDKLSIMRVDVDDPKNDKIVDRYEVSPIPTVVFLNTEGEVVTYNIGYSGKNCLDRGIGKILD